MSNKEDMFVISKENANKSYKTKSKKLNSLFEFFLHEAPDTSSYISRSSTLKLNKEFEGLIQKKYPKVIFCDNAEYQNNIEQLQLCGDNIDPNEKRGVIIKNNNESKYKAFARHIRNSIAHTRYFIIKKGNYHTILFTDCYKSNETMRLVLKQTDLKLIKQLINKYKEESNNGNE